ncbi:helix-turn-helix domain-containing protein [Pseudomonas moraviensis]|jgi:AraC-like DNA-binding protein|uniref:AraC-like transcriptional regulator QhpR n=1 Tax=Pseudomonas TaxID=286 RepID=UPI000F033A63|nr:MULTISPECIES: AraC family transcriptional regulator [Pseudomonas]MXI50252.1 helix-turn-helix domain-containing protein [Pseudomonas moraviensis]WLG64166.1 AraC family transcriptional regulator [Pseudomonas sp. FP1762]
MQLDTSRRYADELQSIGVLSSAATGLIEFIQQKGGDADRIFGHAGFNPEHLQHPTLSLDLKQYCAVFEEAARQTHDDNFGLRYGSQFKPDGLGMLGYVGLCSETLGDALRNVVKVFPIHQQGSLLRFEVEGEWCRLDYQVQYGAIFRKRQDAELSMGMFTNLIRHSIGQKWAPERVHFEHPQPQAWHEHCKAFDAPVFFGQPCNSLVFRRSALDKIMPGRDSRLLSIVMESMVLLARQWGERQGGHDIINDVQAQIRLQFANGEPSLDQVAELLKITSWSLQRRLGEKGLNFSGLVDKVRQELARYYLTQTRLSISELALLLGYSETSAFSRAFRRWHGASPKQCRKSD